MYLKKETQKEEIEEPTLLMKMHIFIMPILRKHTRS